MKKNLPNKKPAKIAAVKRGKKMLMKKTKGSKKIVNLANDFMKRGGMKNNTKNIMNQ